jgi:hypothetical protein
MVCEGELDGVWLVVPVGVLEGVCVRELVTVFVADFVGTDAVVDGVCVAVDVCVLEAVIVVDVLGVCVAV